MKLMRVGVDLAKTVFRVHGVDRSEKVAWRRKLTRGNWLKILLETVEPAPQFVKPYVKSNKNDANDADVRSLRCSDQKGRRPVIRGCLRSTGTRAQLTGSFHWRPPARPDPDRSYELPDSRQCAERSRVLARSRTSYTDVRAMRGKPNAGLTTGSPHETIAPPHTCRRLKDPVESNSHTGTSPKGNHMKNRLVVGCLLILAVGTQVDADDCIKDQYGNVVCGKSQCAPDMYGKVFCAKQGGGAIRDRMGG